MLPTTFRAFEGLRFLFTLQQNAIDMLIPKIKNATRHSSARRSDGLRGVHDLLHPLGLGKTVPCITCLTLNMATKSCLFRVTSTTKSGPSNVRVGTQVFAP